MIVSSYIYIPVSDLEEAAAWYGSNLDFKVVHKDSLYYDLRTENGIRAMLLPEEGDMVSQMRYSTGEQPAYGFCVDDFDGMMERMRQNNIRTGEVFDYFGRSFSIYDPYGNKIEIWEDHEY